MFHPRHTKKFRQDRLTLSFRPASTFLEEVEKFANGTPNPVSSFIVTPLHEFLSIRLETTFGTCFSSP